MKKFILFAVLCLCFVLPNSAKGQKVAVKTNLLYDATATINLGVEYAIAPNWTIDLSGNYNPWTFTKTTSRITTNGTNKVKKRWQHWLVQPEVRWWTCRSFNGHFFAVNAAIGEADIANVKLFDLKLGSIDMANLEHSRFDGWFWGVGVGYGYAWAFSKNWNLEFELAVGYAQVTYSKWGPFFENTSDPTYDFSKDPAWALKGDPGRYKRHRYYVGPTKAAISLVYLF